MKKDRRRLCAVPLHAFTVVFVLGPALYLVAASFAQNIPGSGFRWAFTTEHFARLRGGIYLRCFRESFRLALSTTALSALIGYPFGYFMGRLGTRGKRALLFLIMAPFWTSSLIRLYGWIVILQANGPLNRFLLWLGVIGEPLKILYSYPAVLIGMVYALLPFMILAVYSSVEKMDWTLVEAARDLGASRAAAFLTVTLRLTLPGLMSGVILTFVPSMGLFFVADILGGNKIVLVGSLIQDQMTRGGNQPFAAALALTLAVMTSLMLWLYRALTGTGELEGML